MNKLKKILLEEGTPLIPFGSMFSGITKYWTKSRDGKPDGSFESFRRGGLNIFISITSLMIPLYVAGALSYGANPLKPQDYLQKRKVVLEQRKLQKEQEIKDHSEKQFHNADKNNDLAIDSNEFHDYIKRCGRS